MPEIADSERYQTFFRDSPESSTEVERERVLAWLAERGDFDIRGAEPTVSGEPHTLLVWGEEPDQSYRVYVVPNEAVDLSLDGLHGAVFGARVHRSLEPELFEPAVKLILRASFDPQLYWGLLGDIRAGVTQRRSRLPRDTALEPEVGTWHQYQVDNGAGLNRNIDRVCAVMFMRWS